MREVERGEFLQCPKGCGHLFSRELEGNPLRDAVWQRVGKVGSLSGTQCGNEWGRLGVSQRRSRNEWGWRPCEEHARGQRGNCA